VAGREVRCRRGRDDGGSDVVSNDMAAAPVEGRVLDGPRWEVILWRDIDYLARVQLPYELAMDFEVFEIVGWIEGSTRGEYGVPSLHGRNWTDGLGDTTEDPDEAEPLFHGRVKWDGCSDWAWNTDRIMWHGCGETYIADLAEAMRRTYALAAERIDHWNPM
jgi:hypothetical protein